MKHLNLPSGTRFLLACYIIVTSYSSILSFCHAQQHRRSRTTLQGRIYNHQIFQSKVQSALGQVKEILDTTRHPVLPTDVDHTYEDKYLLVETMTNTAISSIISTLQVAMGKDFFNDDEILIVDDDDDDDDFSYDHNDLSSMSILEKLFDWVYEQHRPVTLTFHFDQKCMFMKQTERKITTSEREVEVKRTTSGGGIFSSSSTKTETETVKVKKTVQQFHYQIQTPYKFILSNNNDGLNGNKKKDDDNDNEIELLNRNDMTTELVVVSSSPNGRRPPPPMRNETETITVDITWLLKQVLAKHDDDHDDDNDDDKHNKLVSSFVIDRTSKGCKTPSQNPNIYHAIEFQKQMISFLDTVVTIFSNIQSYSNRYLPPPPSSSSHDDDDDDDASGSTTTPFMTASMDSTASHLLKELFIPTVPIFEKNSTTLTPTDVNVLLVRHKKHFETRLNSYLSNYAGYTDVQSTSPSSSSSDATSTTTAFLTVKEATIVFCFKHIQDLIYNWDDGIAYVEQMLHDQLIAAIGKEVTANDFDAYMKFHSHKFFASEYIPEPFSYSIRRNDKRYPDGMISIEKSKESSSSSIEREIIETMTRRIPGGNGGGTDHDHRINPPIRIPIDAATVIEMTGDRFLHGWIQTQWNTDSRRTGTSANEYVLTSRANQFSSFLLIVGTMGSQNQLLPKHAIIIQNKDEVFINLLTTTIPSAKEFRDAVRSLSPEQRAFAESYRSMQLETSVTGICVIQIKPQLEKVLNLPDGSLNKEIQLTQDLMMLFQEYQIPSDLLSYDGDDGDDDDWRNLSNDDDNDDDDDDKIYETTVPVPVQEKIRLVKSYVKAVIDVIDAAKEKQLREQKQKYEMEQTMKKQQQQQQQAQNSRFDHYAGFTYSAVPAPTAGPLSMPSAVPTSASMSASMSSSMSSSTQATSSGSNMKRKVHQERQEVQQQQEVEPQRQEQQQQQQQQHEDTMSSTTNVAIVDFTTIPKLIDQKLLKEDKDGALKSTIIDVDNTWKRSRQENLILSRRNSKDRQELSPTSMEDYEIDLERNMAMIC